MSGLWQRLKERKLVQWAVAYVAAAFALLQGLDIVANRFDLPSQTVRLVMLAMSAGFFVTLVLAWYHGERGAQRMTGKELLILALLLTLGGGFLWRFAGTAQERNAKAATRPPSPNESSAPVSRKSIAVLPFENRSASGEDAEFLADGIHEDLINTLSRVPGLKVMSRTSVQRFRGPKTPLPDVATELKVANLVEAGVQRAGDRVRVNVQLIRGADEPMTAR